MVFLNPYESNESKVSKLQRWILVHSYIYYICNNNIVSDRVYDLNAKQLVKMQKEVKTEKTDYGYVFKDFDGNTGFDLFERLTERDRQKIENISSFVLYNYYNNK